MGTSDVQDHGVVVSFALLAFSAGRARRSESAQADRLIVNVEKSHSLNAFGISVFGANATTARDLRLDEDGQGKVFRSVIDRGIKKVLPELGGALPARQRSEA